MRAATLRVFVAALALAAAAAALRGGGGEETPGKWMWCVQHVLPKQALIIECKTSRPEDPSAFQWYFPAYNMEDYDVDTKAARAASKISRSDAVRIIVWTPEDTDTWFSPED